MEHKEVSENGLVGDFYYRKSGKKYLTIILLGGSEGGKPTTESEIEKTVERGYAVLSLAYFGMKGLPRSLESIPLEYFERAISWLAEQPTVVPNHYAVEGVSKGGELALLLASRYPEIRAVVGIVPGSVVFQGIPRGFYAPRSSWSYKGQELPYVPCRFSFDMIKAILTQKFVGVYTRSLKNKEAVERATIPVEKINGPILLVSGKHDEMWPSTYMSNQIVERLEKHDFKHRYEHIACETGHNVFEDPGARENIARFWDKNFKESYWEKDQKW
ncbi:dienelactone hydrolase [Candidatus Acetothermia bacterium]|jgi:dienelactone hydrolase|nr:dienelactone hydrolase [Candidatus Acetothermia bacterium]MCI2427514.1 dienelactone hydrolase [Candidatus Acetothermia bacterium]MCI2428119.1 dienelactone hydrolase [Candidatus Acetothermia bacterium]